MAETEKLKQEQRDNLQRAGQVFDGLLAPAFKQEHGYPPTAAVGIMLTAALYDVADAIGAVKDTLNGRDDEGGIYLRHINEVVDRLHAIATK